MFCERWLSSHLFTMRSHRYQDEVFHLGCGSAISPSRAGSGAMSGMFPWDIFALRDLFHGLSGKEPPLLAAADGEQRQPELPP